jgi:hypothetical protein
MRYFFFVSYLFTFIACQTSKPVKTKEPIAIETASTPEDPSFTYGKVTHLINANPCASIIVINKDTGSNNELILLPKDPLSEDLNKEGTEIKFHYRPLKIKNPEGCLKGMPVALTEVTKR